MQECDIRHDDRHGYYTLMVNGKFQGNYDTMNEAVKEYEQMALEEEKGEKEHE